MKSEILSGEWKLTTCWGRARHFSLPMEMVHFLSMLRENSNRREEEDEESWWRALSLLDPKVYGGLREEFYQR